MTRFLFDMDGTITSVETLPLISNHFQVGETMDELTQQTVQGNIPFVESFIRRVYILGNLPVNEVAELLKDVPIYERLLSFIKLHQEQCVVVTGNLSCWVEKLAGRSGCKFYCSEGDVENNRVKKLQSILKKEDVVKRYQDRGDRVVFIGDGNNDVEAMRFADVAIAAGITHLPARGCMSVADYLVLSEVGLCRQLNQLL